MRTPQTHTENDKQMIYRVNFAYLASAQKLLLRDFQQGLGKTGLDVKTARVIVDLDFVEMDRIANCPYLICGLDRADHVLSIAEQMKRHVDDLANVAIHSSFKKVAH